MTTIQQQLILAYLNYPPGELDGIPGRDTQAATRAFQIAEGLTPDGYCGPITEAALKDAVLHDRFRKEDNPGKTPEGKTGTFWDDIQYFTRAEFRCTCPRCGGFPAEPKEKLIRIADKVRAEAGAKAHVSSGVRCVAHNAELPNSAPNSRHLYGGAMDFRVDGLTSAQLLTLVRKQPGVAFNYAIDDRFVHMDVV